MKYIIVIVILVVIIGGGLWFLSRQAPKEIVVPQETELSEEGNIDEDKVADWETYSDSDLGFSFRYPLEWGMPQRDILSTRTEISFETKLIISTGIYYNQDLMRNMTVEELVGTYKNYKDFKQEEILVGGREATKVSYTSGNNDKIIEVFVAHNDRIVLISSDIAIDNLFDQILSTFRFIEGNETADWQTYRDEEYGFKIKYPNNWFVHDAANEINCENKLTKSQQARVLFSDKEIEDCLEPLTHGWFWLSIWIREEYNEKDIEKNVVFNGIPANKTVETEINEIGDSPRTSIIFNYNNFGWNINYLNSIGGTPADSNFEKMFSTFSFLK